MANKKINELDNRASLSLSDLMIVGDPTTGYAYKTTLSELKTLTGAGVISFNGRFGAVMPVEGDYNLTTLGDVLITSPTNGQVLQFNGTQWVNVNSVNEADTLDSVTDRGNITTNTITIGGATVNGNVDVVGGDIAIDSIKKLYLDRGVGGAYLIATGNGGGIRFGAGYNDRMVLNEAGRLLLGYLPGQDDGSIRLQVNGNARISDLAGTGTRMVIADANGVLSTQAVSTVTNITAGGAIDVSNVGGNVTISHADTSGAGSGISLLRTQTFRSIVLDTYGHLTGLSYDEFYLDDVYDVVLSTPSNGQVLQYDSATGKWVNGNGQSLSGYVQGSGTTNYVAKFTASGTIGNSTIFDNGTNVGIGTASPSDKLQINDGRLRFLESGQRQWNIGIESGTPDFRIREVTFGFTPLTINGSGNVLVNTTTDNLSGAKLQVSGAIFTNSSVLFGGGTGNNWQVFKNGGSNSLEIYHSGGGPALALSTSGAATFSSSVTAGGNVLVPAGSGLAWSGDASRIITPEDNVSGALIQTPGIIRFRTGGSEAMRITSSGNLGIGVTPSAANLPTLEMQYGLFNGTSEVNISQNVVYNSGFKYGANGFATRYYQGNGNHQWFNASSGTAGSAITFTQAMTLTASGNLGIGTSSPASKAHISFQNDFDGLRIQNSNRGHSYLFTTAGSSAEFLSIYDVDNSQYLYQAGNTGHLFLTSGVLRMGITSSGRILMGTTTDNLTDLLQVAGDVYINKSGASTLSLGQGSGTNDYGRINFTGKATGQGNSLMYIPVYNTQSGSSILSGELEIAHEGTSPDNKSYFSLKVHNGTSLINPLIIASTGAATFASTIKTAAPTGGTAQPWKLGTYVASTGTATGHIQIEVNGTTYKVLAYT